MEGSGSRNGLLVSSSSSNGFFASVVVVVLLVGCCTAAVMLICCFLLGNLGESFCEIEDEMLADCTRGNGMLDAGEPNFS